MDNFKEEDKHKYLQKLYLLYDSRNNVVDPYQIPEEQWKDDITLWPPVEYPDIYTYLVDSPGQFTKEKMKAYKSLEAFNYYISGWVQTVYFSDLGSHNCVLKAKVMASQRMNVLHEAWVGVSKKSGTVITGHCSCMAGWGQVCSHVAALLFKLEACVRLQKDEASCTSLPCLWNQAYSKKVQATRAVDMHFFKPSKKRSEKEAQVDKHNSEKRRRLSIIDKEPTLNKKDLYDTLFKVIPDAALFSVLPGYRQPSTCSSQLSVTIEQEPHLPKAFDELQDVNYDSLSDKELKEACSKVFKNIKVTSDEAIFLEKSTKNQSQSWVWYKYRKGRITASHFHDVSHHAWKKYPTSAVKSIMQYNSVSDCIPAIKWGKDHEHIARNEYISKMKDKHTDFKVELSGLIINPSFPYLGASPDGYVSCTCCGNGLSEIKCTYKYRFEQPTVELALYDSNYFLALDKSGSVHLSPSHKYYDQVQGQLSIAERSYCDFVCWTERGIFIERIKKDDTFQKSVPKLEKFFLHYLLPEILTRRLENSDSSKKESRHEEKKITEKENIPDTQNVYCTCRQGEFGKMVACDNRRCPIEWFHFRCVGLKVTPPGKWYCSQCKSSA